MTVTNTRLMQHLARVSEYKRKKLCDHNIPELPFDIIVEIVSRLPLKLIIKCKFLSKDLKNLISYPPFAHFYGTRKSNYFYTISLDAAKPDYSLHLVEFDQEDFHKKKGNQKISNVEIFNTKRLPRESSSSRRLFFISGYCNGLLCLLKLELGLYHAFVINPILGEFIQLPEHVVEHKSVFFSYGVGYCQLNNTYKVLRLTTKYVGGSNYKSCSEIFTIGYDQNWRCIWDFNVPYNMKWEDQRTNPQSIMVPLRSALHWIVQPVPMPLDITIKPNWGAKIRICAFDMIKEKASALQLPLRIFDFRPFLGVLSVLLDKLCFWKQGSHLAISDLWVMDEYGAEGSWTKKLALKMDSLGGDIGGMTLPPLTVSRPLTISPEGVIVVSQRYKLVFYDMKKKKWLRLRVIHKSEHLSSSIPFVPNFASLRNLVRTPGLMTYVQPCSPVSEAARGLLQLKDGPKH